MENVNSCVFYDATLYWGILFVFFQQFKMQLFRLFIAMIMEVKMVRIIILKLLMSRNNEPFRVVIFLFSFIKFLHFIIIFYFIREFHHPFNDKTI